MRECIFTQDIHHERMYIYPRYPPWENVIFTQDIHHERMYIHPRYPPWENVYSPKISTMRECTFTKDIHHARMYIYPRYPPCENVHLPKIYARMLRYGNIVMIPPWHVWPHKDSIYNYIYNKKLASSPPGLTA